MKLWKHLLTKLQNHQNVYLLTVIDNLGSSPGRKGFKMLVAEDGFIFGSIGGGVMEFSLVEEAQQLLILKKPPIFIKKQIHRGTIKDGSGMICSGEQTVAFHLLTPSYSSCIQRIISCLVNGEKGTLSLFPSHLDFSSDILEHRFECLISSKENWFFKEHIGFKNTLYIIGGGHVSFAVSELFVKLGFYVVVLDNREQLNTLENNNSAHQKIVTDYQSINSLIPEENNTYIAIMTNKYVDDKLVLSKLIKGNYKFIGVLGSNAKLKTMWETLLKDGFSQNELNSIYAPIGLSIKSETPEEIAVSIAAQIIQIKNTPT
ncbi:XdhC family protein [Tenacibaculum maritimum]|uniref:XdhC family protein n=1 Tax=Tenacibaculum maritimum TaxID=107401 RepID=UPI001E50961B|nr:XdhC/CoxI family protein [Tenacibaculum maritimum]MCD9583733.1 XdhC family protein [Tenacibaculum maritimum]MCD9619461.1 XdhC family protein [Tenacibaculum maritimum]MCD9626198.1 XdhC family protein [Tenacibaculum maritimum]MCD9630596.1 XdhC family protein [Tenacibaculum maritimum]MCD9631589.1 XdhC family protein [Tenacibaculum maritimum]